LNLYLGMKVEARVGAQITKYLPPPQDQAVWKLNERAPPEPREACIEDRGTIVEIFAST
jgi:hypothetical protein